MATKKSSPELNSWIELNSALMAGDLKLAQRLLEEEKAGRKRKQFILRIHSRINRLRAGDERKELMKSVA